MRDEPETGRKSARRVHARLAAAAVAMSGSYGRTNNRAVCPSAAPLAECSGTGGPNTALPLSIRPWKRFTLPMKSMTNSDAGWWKLLGRSRLLDARLVHHHHAVGHFQRFLLEETKNADSLIYVSQIDDCQRVGRRVRLCANSGPGKLSPSPSR